MEYALKVFEIAGPIIALIAAIWGFFKLFYKFKSKFLLITNCQILHKVIWKDISDHYGIKQNGEQDFAFRPLILLPHSMKKYSRIKNGQKAILESVSQDKDNNLKIIAEVYWIPEDMEPWNKVNHPAFSLVLRRYFGIERPMYQDETSIRGDWQIVKHSVEHLDHLNRTVDDKFLQWAVADKYTYRYFDPKAGEKGIYFADPVTEGFIEYCGLSIVLRKHSFFSIDK